MTELFKKTATEVVELLKAGEITPAELLEVAISRIEAVDGQINALPIRCFDRAQEQAKKMVRPEFYGTISIYDLTTAWSTSERG